MVPQKENLSEDVGFFKENFRQEHLYSPFVSNHPHTKAPLPDKMVRSWEPALLCLLLPPGIALSFPCPSKALVLNLVLLVPPWEVRWPLIYPRWCGSLSRHTLLTWRSMTMASSHGL